MTPLRPGAKPRVWTAIHGEEQTCPNGDPRCHGKDDLEAGVLPCRKCAAAATDEEWTEFLRCRDVKPNEETVAYDCR